MIALTFHSEPTTARRNASTTANDAGEMLRGIARYARLMAAAIGPCEHCGKLQDLSPEARTAAADTLTAIADGATYAADDDATGGAR